MKSLTEQQQRVLNMFFRCARLGSPPPSHRDLCREFGWSSTATARDHIRALVRKGLLCGAGGRARGTHVVLSARRKAPITGRRLSGGKRAPREIASTDDLSKPTKTSPSSGTGHAAAAHLNRQRQARIQIREALVRLGVGSASWPSFVNAPLASELHHTVIPPSFQPPNFERLHQSVRDWQASADNAWKEHRDKWVRTLQFWVEKGIDEQIVEAKQARNPGIRGSRRKNSVVTVRYEWAAKRLCGCGWKEISKAHFPDAVRKAASEVLRLAGWPAKLSEIKAAQNSSPN